MQFPNVSKLLFILIPSAFLNEFPLLIFYEPAKSIINSFDVTFCYFDTISILIFKTAWDLDDILLLNVVADALLANPKSINYLTCPIDTISNYCTSTKCVLPFASSPSII